MSALDDFLAQEASPVLTGDDLRSRIAKEAEKRGLPQGLSEAIIKQESGWDINNKQTKSTAQGLFQLLEPERKGITSQDDEIRIGMDKIKDSYLAAKNALGREPTFGEAYVPYWQGLAGGKAILSNPNASFTDTLDQFGKNYAKRVVTANPELGGITSNQDFIAKASGLLGETALSTAPSSTKPSVIDDFLAGETAAEQKAREGQEKLDQLNTAFKTFDNSTTAVKSGNTTRPVPDAFRTAPVNAPPQLGMLGDLGIKSFGGAQEVAKLTTGIPGLSSLANLIAHALPYTNPLTMGIAPTLSVGEDIYNALKGNPALGQETERIQAGQNTFAQDNPGKAFINDVTGQTIAALPSIVGAEAGLTKLGVGQAIKAIPAVGKVAESAVRGALGGGVGAIANRGNTDEPLSESIPKSALVGSILGPATDAFIMNPINKFLGAKTTPEIANTVDLAKQHGINLGAAEVIADPTLREEALKTAGFSQTSPKQLTQTVMKEVGADKIASQLNEPGYTAKVVKEMRKDLGNQYETWGKTNNVEIDPTVWQGINQIHQDLQRADPAIARPVTDALNGIFRRAVQNPTTGRWSIPGDDFIGMTRESARQRGTLSSLINSSNTELQQYGYELKGLMDQSLKTNSNATAADALNAIDRKYAINEDVSKLASRNNTTGVLPASGIGEIADTQAAKGNLNFWDDISKISKFVPDVDEYGNVPKVNAYERPMHLAKSTFATVGPGAAIALEPLVESGQYLNYLTNFVAQHPGRLMSALGVTGAAAGRNAVIKSALKNPALSDWIAQNSRTGAIPARMENPFVDVLGPNYRTERKKQQ